MVSIDEEQLRLLPAEATEEDIPMSASFIAQDEPIEMKSLTQRMMECVVSAFHSISPLHDEPNSEESFEKYCTVQIREIDEWKFKRDPSKVMWRYIFIMPTSEAETETHLQEAMSALEENPGMMHDPGPLGALPIHLAGIIGTPYHLRMMWSMVNLDEKLRKNRQTKLEWTKRHPMRLVLRYYHSDKEAEDLFHGENLLHIAIVRRDLEMAQELLERAPALMVGRCSGSFFYPGRSCYFGSTPLQFAATTNNRKMVQLILKYAPRHAAIHEISLTGVPGQKDDRRCMIGTDRRECVQRLRMLDERDEWGNNILHALVYQSSDNADDGRDTLVRMWDFLCVIQAQLRREVYEATKVVHSHKLEDALNENQLTPFVLAANIGKKNIFLHILRNSSIVNWRYGPLVCRSYPLDGLDAPPAMYPNAPCALDELIANGYMPFFEVSVIQRLLNRKWAYYAQRIFFYRLFATIAFSVVMIIVAITQNQLDPDTRPRPSADDLAALQTVNTIGKIFLMLGTSLQFAKEARQVLEGGIVEYFSETGAAFMENACNCFFFLCFGMSGITLAFGLDRGVSHAFMAMTCIALAAYYFFFFLGFSLTGPYVVMIGKMITTDLARFAFAFLVIVLGFATCFHVLFMQSTLGDFLLTVRDTFLLALGQIDPNQFFVGVYAPWFCTTLMLLYLMTVNILLLNLLIATMGQTYADMLPFGTLTWLLERARITQSICQEFNPTPAQEYFVKQTPPPEEGLPPEVDPSRWTKQRYLLALETQLDDMKNLCEDDQAAGTDEARPDVDDTGALDQELEQTFARAAAAAKAAEAAEAAMAAATASSVARGDGGSAAAATTSGGCA
eukprot:TRINITY_DN24472_c0_g1_i1.p1 TRINITY_DN24472_c0_g1~~TRINITY_DN24472_c0_g1_i1.p1  ORF type:complete len:844 (-),score=214.65 TRINITY_DN24472_c0_g1_i1:781-3312(-)